MRHKVTLEEKDSWKVAHDKGISIYTLAKRTRDNSRLINREWSTIARHIKPESAKSQRLHKRKYEQSEKGILSKRYNEMKQKYKKDGLWPVLLTKEEFLFAYDIQIKKSGLLCVYTGKQMTFKAGDDNVISVDRRDTNAPYSFWNIKFVTWRGNKLKGSATLRIIREVLKDEEERREDIKRLWKIRFGERYGL